MKFFLSLTLAFATAVTLSAQRHGGGMGGGDQGRGEFTMPPDNNLRNVVVTVVPKHADQPAAAITASDVTVKQGDKEDKIKTWQPVGDKTVVDLAIIIDDDTRNINVQLDDVRAFIRSLPANVYVGIGYMSAGAILFTQSKFSTDRDATIEKLRAPAGDGNASPNPFASIQFLMSRWHPAPGHVAEMLLISDGVEHIGGNNASDVEVRRAVQAVAQSGVVVYSIVVAATATQQEASTADNTGGSVDGYGAGGNQPEFGTPLGASRSKNLTANMNNTETGNGGLNLAELTDATGGVTYSQGRGTPPRFTDFLGDITTRMKNQYLLSFDVSKGSKGLNGIKIDVQAPDAKVTAPKQVVIG